MRCGCGAAVFKRVRNLVRYGLQISVLQKEVKGGVNDLKHLCVSIKINDRWNYNSCSPEGWPSCTASCSCPRLGHRFFADVFPELGNEPSLEPPLALTFPAAIDSSARRCRDAYSSALACTIPRYRLRFCTVELSAFPSSVLINPIAMAYLSFWG